MLKNMELMVKSRRMASCSAVPNLYRKEVYAESLRARANFIFLMTYDEDLLHGGYSAIRSICLGSEIDQVDPDPVDLHPGRLKMLALVGVALDNSSRSEFLPLTALKRFNEGADCDE